MIWLKNLALNFLLIGIESGQYTTRVTSKTWLLVGSFFSIPVSLDPSIAITNGSFLINSTRRCWKNGAMAPLTMHAVFVHYEVQVLAIWLSENTSRNNGVSSSAKANGMLQWTSNVATLTSAWMTFLVNALETGWKLSVDCNFAAFTFAWCNSFADMPFHVMSAHVAAADISVTKSAVKTVLVSTHLVDKRIHLLYPCWAKFCPVDISAFHLS